MEEEEDNTRSQEKSVVDSLTPPTGAVSAANARKKTKTSQPTKINEDEVVRVNVSHAEVGSSLRPLNGLKTRS